MSLGNVTVYDYLSSITGSIEDICADFFYKFIKNNTDSQKNFRSFLELWAITKSNNKNEVSHYFDEKQYLVAFHENATSINKILTNLVHRNEIPDKFYTSLWENLCNPAMFATDLDVICALLFLAKSPLIPYFQMGEALTMETAEYQALSTAILPYAQKAIFALNLNYEQLTQVASQLISIMSEIDDYKKQVVYVAQLLSWAQWQVKRIEEQSLSRSSEDCDISQ